MAARVTVHEVVEITGPVDIKDNVIRNNFMVSATTFVDDHLTTVGLSTAALKQIELYLAAHFLTLTTERGGLVKDDFGDAEVEWANVYDQGFKSTRFGQTALSLDTSGTLLALTTNKLKAKFGVV